MNTSSPLVQIRPRSHERYLRLPIFGRCIEAFTRWSLSKGYKQQTLRLHLEALQRLVPRFLRRGIRSPRDLTDDDVQAAKQRFKERSPHVAEGICAFGRFLKEGHGLKPGRRQPPCPSERLISRVVEYLRNDCGLAESTWQRHRSHLRQFLQFIGFDRSKTAIQKLIRHLFISQSAPARPLSPHGVYSILGRASRTTGVLLPTRRFHSLRYACALRLMRKGVSLKAISDVFGHQDVNTSGHYLRLDVDDLRQ